MATRAFQLERACTAPLRYQDKKFMVLPAVEAAERSKAVQSALEVLCDERKVRIGGLLYVVYEPEWLECFFEYERVGEEDTLSLVGKTIGRQFPSSILLNMWQLLHKLGYSRRPKWTFLTKWLLRYRTATPGDGATESGRMATTGDSSSASPAGASGAGAGGSVVAGGEDGTAAGGSLDTSSGSNASAGASGADAEGSVLSWLVESGASWLGLGFKRRQRSDDPVASESRQMDANKRLRRTVQPVPNGNDLQPQPQSEPGPEREAGSAGGEGGRDVGHGADQQPQEGVMELLDPGLDSDSELGDQDAGVGAVGEDVERGLQEADGTSVEGGEGENAELTGPQGEAGGGAAPAAAAVPANTFVQLTSDKHSSFDGTYEVCRTSNDPKAMMHRRVGTTECRRGGGDARGRVHVNADKAKMPLGRIYDIMYGKK